MRLLSYVPARLTANPGPLAEVFRNNALASYHGEKSGHDQFEESTEEIKPLTEEEKAAKLEEVRIS